MVDDPLVSCCVCLSCISTTKLVWLISAGGAEKAMRVELIIFYQIDKPFGIIGFAPFMVNGLNMTPTRKASFHSGLAGSCSQTCFDVEVF